MPTRILLTDDHSILRQGLRRLLEREPDMQVIGESQDGRSAVATARELSPDIVVMDVSMPELNGIDATRQLTHAGPVAHHAADGNGVGGTGNGGTPKVIALSMHSDRRFADEMIRAGASGYLVKTGAYEELANAIREVMAGKVYMSPLISNTDATDRVAGGRPSPREREVLQLISEGKSTKEIAACLNVSVKTVETHRRQLMEKLGLYSVAELTKYAVREGLTSVE